MKQHRHTVIALIALTLFVAPVFGAGPSPLADGKTLFDGRCGTCHEIERSLAMQSDRAGWETRIKRMVANGAKIDKSESARILDYLTAKSSFETKCNTCHNLEKPLAAIKNPKEWQATVARMAAMKPGTISDVDAGAIALYLSLVTPIQPPAKQ
jgi:cytochrome c5